MKERVNHAARWRFGRTQTYGSGMITVTLLVTSLLLGWEYMDIASNLYSKPSHILEVFVTDYARLFGALYQSSSYVFFGVLTGTLIGTMLGLIAAAYNRAWVTIFMVSAILIGYPKTAVFLLFVGYYGVLSDSSLYAMTFYNVTIFMFFMVFRTTRNLLTEVNSPRLEVSVQLFETRTETIWYAVVPQVLPVAISSAAYISLGLWPFLIFAEPTGSPGVNGIGNYVMNAYQSGWWDHLYAGALVITVTALGTVAVLLGIGRLVAYRL